jgi:hypothetical protein
MNPRLPGGPATPLPATPPVKRSRPGRTVLAARLAIAARVLTLAVLAGALVGCKSYSPSQYVSPRVTGRVLDARTRAPLPDVTVRRIDSDGGERNFTPQHGGEMMMQSPGVRSRPDGTFVLEAVRDLSPLHHIHWYSVSLSFERSGYDRLLTNYSRTSAISTPDGAPLITAGDILLQPRSP